MTRKNSILHVLTLVGLVLSLIGPMVATPAQAAPPMQASVISFTGGELLGKPTDTSITINIVPDTTIEYHYQYGTSPSSYTLQTSNETATGGQPHEVVIDGLAANTRYYYRMRYHAPEDGEPVENWVTRDEHTFHTQRDEGEEFVFTVTSDSHAQFNTAHQNAMTNILNNDPNDPNDPPPDFNLDLGDTFMVDNTSSQSAVNADYLAYRNSLYMGKIGPSVPIFLTPGNHENEEGWNFDDTPFSIALGSVQARKAYYPTPIDEGPGGFYSGNTDPLAAIDETTYGDEYREDYYAWEWGDALFVVIDEYQYTMDLPYNPTAGEGSEPVTGDQWSWTLGEEQFNWFKQTIEESDAKYKFVFSHHVTGGRPANGGYVRGGAGAAPYFEWGGKNADGSEGFEAHRPGWGGVPIHQLMVQNGVSAYFHGHDHQYVYESLDGVVYQEVPSPGMGGSGFGGIYNESDSFTHKILPNSGHLRITVTPTQATVDYISSTSTAGTVNYSYTIAPNASGPTHVLTTAVSPSGGGAISPAAGTHTYDEGTVVTITATPNTGYTFSSWSGDCTGSGPCSVTMDADKTVTANFTAVPTYVLTTAVSPTGGGTINPAAGTHTYNQGDVVTVTATPNSGYTFSSWGGDCSGSGSCSVTMDADKSVTANFVAATTITFTGSELLGRPTDTSISVSIVPDSDISLYYQYGTTSEEYTAQTSTTSATGGQPKVVVISGLTPNTKYYYRMQYSADGGTTWVARPEHSFYTRRAAGSTFTFDVTSDGHVNILMGNATTWTNTLNDVAEDDPDFHLDLGDTVAMRSVSAGDVAGAEAAYKYVLPFFNLVSASSPIFLVPGNHEQKEAWHLLSPLADSLPVIGTNAQKKYFLNPVPDSFYTGDTSTYPYLDDDQLREDYYAWTWGDALFVVIDPYWFSTTKPYVSDPGGGETDTTGSGDSWDWTLGQDQFNWLKTTLQNSTAKYKFVFSHQIVGDGSISGQEDYGHGGANHAQFVEWGGYNEDGTTWGWDAERSGWGSQPIHQLMVANGVSAFFHGHDHQYAYEKRDGIVYQAVPAAGFTGNFGIYTTGSGNTIWADSTQGSGHLRVTVGPSQTTVDFIRTGATTSAYSYTMEPAGEPEPGTVSLDGAVSSNTAASGSSITINHTTGTGTNRLMLVGVSWNSGSNERTISSVTFSYGAGPTVLTMNPVVTRKHASQNRDSAIYSLLDPPSGQSGTVTVNFSDSVSNGIMAGVANFAGVDQTTPFGTTNGADGNSTGPSVTLTGLDGDELVFDNVFQGAGSTSQTLTVGSGQTQLWNPDYVANLRAAASTEQATGSSVTMSWTAASSSYWVIVAVPINPAAAGPTQDLIMAVNPPGGGTTVPDEGTHTYPQGAVVDISATPNVGYVFDSWTGDVADSGDPTTTVTMDEDQVVTANFMAQSYDLTMAVDPSGGGTTTPAVGGPYSYGAGAVVDITATANTGYVFDHWTGDGVADVNAASTTVTMDDNKTVTAHFAEVTGIILDGAVSSGTADGVSSIEVAHTTGTGTNRLMLVGISANSYNNARTISSVTFTPDGESAIALDEVGSIENEAGRLAAIYGLVNPPSGQAGTVTVTFSGSVGNGIVVGVANFAGVDQSDPLDDFASAVGTEANPINVDVPTDLNDLVFDTVFLGAATVPSLTADASQTQLWDATVDRVRGVASTEQATTTSTPMSWTASGGSTSYYWAIGAVPINPAAVGPTHDLTMAVDPTEGGSTNPAVGVHTYAEDTVVSLSATPNSGYIFDSWTGDADCADGSVTMDADKTCTANFVEAPPTGEVTVDGAASSETADDVASISFAHTTGSGENRLLLVGVSWNSGSTERDIASVIFNDGTTDHYLSEVIDEQAASATAPRNAAIYSLLDPPGGASGTVTVNFDGAVSNGIVAGAVNFAGVNQADPLGTPDGGTASSSAAPTVTLSGLDGDELVFDTVFQGASGETQTLTPGADQTEQWNAWIANVRAAASVEEATGSSVTMSWTASSSSVWVIAAVPINPAPTGTTYELTMAVEPEGSGTTTPAVGVYSYPENEVVNITATPADGYEFDHWTGDVADPNSASTTVTMDEDQTVTAHFTETTSDLTGTVTLQGREDPPDPSWSVPLTVELYEVGQATPAYSFTPTTDNWGEFTVSDIVPGTYEIAVKNSHTLQVVDTVTLAAGSNTHDFDTLPEGDANDDNFVTGVDFSILSYAFGTCQGDTGFDDRADFNEDSCVTGVDFSLLSNNFGQNGE